jgi:DNA-directed RNA polymerase subunit F
MIIKNKIPIPNAEVKAILMKKMKKRELDYEQQLAYEYLKNTTKLSKTNAEKLMQELQEIGLKEEQLINIINLALEDEQTLKLIMKKEKDIKSEKLKDILKILKKYK